MARTFVTLAACLALTACGSLIPAKATVAVAQGDTSLDLAYNAVAQVYLAALPSMTPALKAQVKPVLVKAYAAVQAADNAEKLGDAAGLAAQAQAAELLITEAKLDLSK